MSSFILEVGSYSDVCLGKSTFKSGAMSKVGGKLTFPNCFDDQPLSGNIVVFVVCCLFPSLLGFNPTLARGPPVLSEERHRGWMTNKLQQQKTLSRNPFSPKRN